MKREEKISVQAAPTHEFAYFFRRTEELKERENFVFENCQFTEITQIGCEFTNCKFYNCVFSVCLFHRCDFRHCEFQNCFFRGANFYTCLWENCLFIDVFVSNTDFNENILFNNWFTRLDFCCNTSQNCNVNNNTFDECAFHGTIMKKKFWRRNRKCS